VAEQLVSPLPEAVRRLASKTPVATRLRTAEWEQLPVAVRERALWSAGVESVRFLVAMQDKLGKRLALEQEAGTEGRTAYVDRGSFIADARSVAVAEGIGTGKGGLTDVQSRTRLGLIYDFQTRQAAEFARWRMGADPDVLDAYPAQELVREEEREAPRDWAARWAAAGGRFFEGRMIALKPDPIWTRISRFGTPFPPYDFGSGMGIQDVSREEAEELGAVAPGQRVEGPDAGFGDRLEASVAELPEQARGEFKRVFGDRVSVAGDSLAWVGEKGTLIGELWDRTLADPGVDAVVSLGPPRPPVLERIRAVIGAGRDTEGIVDTVSSKDLNHIRNTHAEGRETNPANLPMTREDLVRIPLLLDKPDDVLPGNHPATVRLVRRFLDGTVYYVEAYVTPKTSWPSGMRKAPPELRTKNAWKTRPEGPHLYVRNGDQKNRSTGAKESQR